MKNRTPRVIVVADKFRGTLGATQACDAIADGVLRSWPHCMIDRVPIADGGEGTIEAIVRAEEGSSRTASVTGPLGEPIDIMVGTIGRDAVIESAACAGIGLLKTPEPLRASTRGVGDAIASVARHGKERVMVGIGGTASTDGGTGAARAVGWRFVDANGHDLREGGGALETLHAIEPPPSRTLEVETVGMCDVGIPLLGPSGAAARFGPQKGASPEQVVLLERGLDRLAAIVRRDVGVELDGVWGAGAGGGLGAGLVAFFSASLVSGARHIARRLDVRARIEAADLVITGEGAFDATSIPDKVPAVVAELATDAGVPCYLVAGRIDVDERSVRAAGFADHSEAFDRGDAREAVRAATASLIARIR